MERKEEAIQKINEFLESTPDEFVMDSYEFTMQVYEDVLGKHIETINYSSREAMIEEINNLLLKLPEKNVMAMSICVVIGYSMYIQNKTKNKTINLNDTGK